MYIVLGNRYSGYLKCNQQVILIHNAPDPTDVQWHNLSYEFWVIIFNYILLYFYAFAILTLSFYIQWLVIRKVYTYRMETEKRIDVNSIQYKFYAILSSLIIIIANFLLRVSIYYSSFLHKEISMTKFNESFCNMYIPLVFFNSALMPYLIDTIYKEQSSFLIYNIHIILLSNAFSTPLYKLFDPVYFLKKILQFYIRYKKDVNITQIECNEIFESHYIDLAENYAYVTRTLYLSTWYASVAPLGIIFSIVGLIFNYWLDKYLLLRVYSYPQNQNENIIFKYVNNLEILPYLYLFGAIEYTRRLIISANLADYIFSFLLYGITSATLTFCYLVYIILWKGIYCWFINRKIGKQRSK